MTTSASNQAFSEAGMPLSRSFTAGNGIYPLCRPAKFPEGGRNATAKNPTVCLQTNQAMMVSGQTVPHSAVERWGFRFQAVVFDALAGEEYSVQVTW